MCGWGGGVTCDARGAGGMWCWEGLARKCVNGEKIRIEAEKEEKSYIDCVVSCSSPEIEFKCLRKCFASPNINLFVQIRHTNDISILALMNLGFLLCIYILSFNLLSHSYNTFSFYGVRSLVWHLRKGKAKISSVCTLLIRIMFYSRI